MDLDKDHSDDPSLLRDMASSANAEERFDCLVGHVVRLAHEVHSIKGNLAANTTFTKEMLEGQDALKVILAKIDVDKINQLVTAVDAMQGGVKVLGWLERPAKWIAAIGAAAAVIYSLWNHK